MCGPPITPEYLSGESNLPIPPLSITPSGTWSKALIGVDLAGFPTGQADQVPQAIPQYELEGYTLGKTIKTAAESGSDLGSEHPKPDLEHTARWMVSLYLWREFLFGNDAAVGDGSYLADASAFAHHTAKAMNILLRPWTEGRIGMRPGMLPRWPKFLDSVVAEIIRVTLAKKNGDFSELAIWEIAGGDPQLIIELRAFQDERRHEGWSEEAIANAIRRGDESDD